MPTMQHVGSPPSGGIAPSDLRFAVGELARHPGAHRREQRSVALAGLVTGGSSVPDAAPLDVDVRLEGVREGLVVSGRVGGHWEAECSRCLEPVAGPFSVEVHELFEDDPVESETYLLDGDEVDLEPMVRDVVVLELPGAPLCADDCAGLCPSCGVNRNQQSCECTTDDRDPRWAALDELRLGGGPEPDDPERRE